MLKIILISIATLFAIWVLICLVVFLEYLFTKDEEEPIKKKPKDQDIQMFKLG